MELSVMETKAHHLSLTYKALKKLGITYFSYGLIQEGRILSSCFSNQEWGALYKKKNYCKVDPLFLGVIRSNLPLIVWDACRPEDVDGQRIMQERNDICKIKSGLTIGLLNKNKKEIIALGAEVSSKEFYGLLKEEQYLSEIHHIIKCFYAPLEGI